MRDFLKPFLVWNLGSLVLGAVLQVAYLVSDWGYNGIPWWCDNEEDLIVGDGSGGVVYVSYVGGETGGTHMMQPSLACPQFPTWWIYLVGVQIGLEIFMRFQSLRFAATRKNKIVNWADKEEEITTKAALLVQRKFRGVLTRHKVCADHAVQFVLYGKITNTA